MYDYVKQLPKSVRSSLPAKAQRIYQKVFNNAWQEYKSPEKRDGNTTPEETAHRVAWSAVKKKFTKHGDNWKSKEQ